MKHTTEGVEFVQLDTCEGVSHVNPEHVSWVQRHPDDPLKSRIILDNHDRFIINEPLDTVLAKLQGGPFQAFNAARRTPADEDTEPLKIGVYCLALDWVDFVRDVGKALTLAGIDNVTAPGYVSRVVNEIDDQLGLFGSILKKELAEREKEK